MKRFTLPHLVVSNVQPKGAVMRHITHASYLSLWIGAVLVSSAYAQSGDAVDLDSVSVTGVRASIQQSLVEKHSASGIVDAISAEDIGKFPDLNLSESLQRISGITIDRNNLGEGGVINLRGLGPAFTQVEINGMPGMSTGGEARTSRSAGTREFNFEMFASELFSKATVYKTGMAEVDEGGLAGTVRLETPRPLDRSGTQVVASVIGNYSETGGNTDPRAALLFSHNKDDVFGVAASIAWSETDFVSNVIQAGSWNLFSRYDDTGIADTDPVHAQRRAALVPGSTTFYVFSEDRKTTGSTLTLQFRPNEYLGFTVDGLYGTLRSTRLHQRNDMPIDTGVNAIGNVIVENGVVTAGDFTGVRQNIGSRYYTIEEDYQQIVASMEWTPNEYWSIRPSLGYARRKAERTFDTFSFRLADSNGVFDPGTLTYQVRGNFVDFSSNLTDLQSNPQDFLFNNAVMIPSMDRDQDRRARVDVAHYFAGNDHVLKFGLRYNEHTKDRSAGQMVLSRAGVPASALPGLDGLHSYVDFKVKGSGPDTPSRMLSVDKRRFLETFMPGGVARAGTVMTDFIGERAAGTYEIEEKTAAAWGQMELLFAAWTLIPGVRYVRTEQISNGFDVANANLVNQRITQVRSSKTYHGILPSLTARYDLGEKIVLRGAYARTLTRPNPSDLSPGERTSGTRNGIGFLGNPTLDPYYANNYDLGAEWYFSAEGLIAINVFYKKISDFIDNRSFPLERTYLDQTTLEELPTIMTFTEPVNGVSASIKGVEISLQSRFSRLPDFWGNFGGILNYTHTDSSADFGQENDVRRQGMPGLSKNSINAVLYYDDGRFDARLAWAWRDRYLAQFADLYGIPRFTDDYAQLDLSLSYRVTSKLSIQMQVLNLTDEQRIDHSLPPASGYLPFAVSTIDRRFMVGLRMVF